MSMGLEIEIKNIRLKDTTRLERSGRKTKLVMSPFPFKEIVVESSNTLRGILLARFSNLEGVTPTLNSILRALKAIGEFDKIHLKIGSFYELDLDFRRGTAVAVGLVDMRRKNFKLQDIEKLEIGKIWRKIYEY